MKKKYYIALVKFVDRRTDKVIERKFLEYALPDVIKAIVNTTIEDYCYNFNLRKLECQILEVANTRRIL